MAARNRIELARHDMSIPRLLSRGGWRLVSIR
jgi:hypothetical protein